MSPGLPASIEIVRPVLASLALTPLDSLIVVGNKVGVASDFKKINQVFCTVQIAFQGETLAFAKALGLNIRLVNEAIKASTGESFMCELKSTILDFSYPYPSQLAIEDYSLYDPTPFPNLVWTSSARRSHFHAPPSPDSEQIFTAALAAGLEKEDNGLVSKLWGKLSRPPIVKQLSEEEAIRAAEELRVESSIEKHTVLLVGQNQVASALKKALQKADIDVVEHEKGSR
nr:hypothetical protein L203_03416 [Cryptococcus depauperatus CBS 7841]